MEKHQLRMVEDICVRIRVYTPPKTNMTMENDLNLNTRYIFKWMIFSPVMFVFGGVDITPVFTKFFRHAQFLPSTSC